ncbi:MAG TPA: peptidoglycan-binding protein, partial [Intrasporangiaceae bacterium]|nr:peptidoglycan-binding protein [Intrasporangiaceae bacterium]
ASTTIQRGSRGAAVTALQKALGGLTADGVFGAKTEAKVKEFQQAKELTVDGVVNPNVWNALMGRSYTKTAGAQSPAPGPTPDPSSNTDPAPADGATDLTQYQSIVLRLGSRGDAVAALQKALGGLTADGVFGTRTELRVKEFQRSKELVVDGVVGRQTWAALIAG